MDELNIEIVKLQAALADPDLYSKDPEKFNISAAKLEKAENDLESAEEKWLNLEMLKDQIEGS